MKKMFFLPFLFSSLLLLSQNNSKLSKDFNSDDSTALLTIASYPDSVRTKALQACQKPEVLVKIEALQKNTSQSFRDLVSNYNKDEQQKLWDLSRQPGLINQIAFGGKKSTEELKAIAEKYPNELKKNIIDGGKKHYEALVEINNLQVNSQKEFERIIANYPAQTQTAYRGLVNHPDILNTLSTNMHLAVILGDMYTSAPQQTAHMLDSINVEHIKQSAKDLEDWKNGLENNPEAKQEMEQAAKEFTKENHPDDYYADDVYNQGTPNQTNEPIYTNPPNTNYANLQPYPYWFGYPWWYDYPYWYPYPYWYNLGFYWGPMGIVYMGFPSPYFMHWYFYSPYHHYYYSHFSDYAIGYHQQHYNGPRYQHTGFNSEIHRWARTNEPNLPGGYLKADAQRPERIKELGKFEMDYHNSTKGVFGRNMTRPEFLQNNANYYPHINPVISQPRFNAPINYPQQQSTPRFNMQNQNNSFSPRGGTFQQPQIQRGGGGIGRPRR